MIRRLASGEAAACQQIMRSLPKWFGIPEAIDSYTTAAETMETYVAERSGAIVGFITVNQRNPVSAEIHVIAVREQSHGGGVGRSESVPDHGEASSMHA